MNRLNKLLILLPVFLLLSGCATQYKVRVDGLSTREAGMGVAGKTYDLASRMQDIAEDDLFFKEIARHVDPVLQEAGYRKAAEGSDPDLVIRIDGHLSEPLVETRSYSEPIYYERPGYARTVRIPVVDKDGKVLRYAYRQYWTAPRSTFAGYVDRDEQRTVYDKVLHLSARKVKEDGTAGEEVWSLKIALRGVSTDYRSALPVMLVAAQPYIGQRTEGEQVITISEDNPDLEAYRQLVSHGG